MQHFKTAYIEPVEPAHYAPYTICSLEGEYCVGSILWLYMPEVAQDRFSHIGRNVIRKHEYILAAMPQENHDYILAAMSQENHDYILAAMSQVNHEYILAAMSQENHEYILAAMSQENHDYILAAMS